MAQLSDAERDVLLDHQRAAQRLADQYYQAIATLPDLATRDRLRRQVDRDVRRANTATTADQALAAYTALEDFAPTLHAAVDAATAQSHEREQLQAGVNEARDLAQQYYRAIQRIPNAAQQRQLENQVRQALNAVERAQTVADQQAALNRLVGLDVSITGARENERARQKLQRHQHRRSASEVLGGSHLLVPHGKDVRFIDAGITIIVASGSVIWTASRNHANGSDILWALFWTGLGGVMAVEGSGELRYGGFGVSAANAAYLALRLFGGIEPQVL